MEEHEPEVVILSDSDDSEMPEDDRSPDKRQRSLPEAESIMPESEALSLMNEFIDQNLSWRNLFDMIGFTEVLRIGTLPEYSDKLQVKYNIRGVPLKRDFTLFQHQIDALHWMRKREAIQMHGMNGGIVCLQMGMGKTLTALTHILSSPKGNFPTLVIASRTVLCEWLDQGCQKFFQKDSVKTLFLHKDYLGEKNLSEINRRTIQMYDIVLTTYDMLISLNRKHKFYDACIDYINERVDVIRTMSTDMADKPHLTGASVIYGTPWHRVICDESQRFANPSTVIYKCVMAVHGTYKWCLSGTPIRNYTTDIWAQLRFCGYNGVERATDWNKTYKIKYQSDDLVQSVYYMTYKDAKISLPTVTDHIIEVELEGQNRVIYDLIVARTMEVYRLMTNGMGDFANVLAMFLRMRQCVIAPYLLTQMSKRSKKDGEDQGIHSLKTDTKAYCTDKQGEAGFQAAKIRKIIEVLQDIPLGEKVVFFTMFTSYLDLVADAIEHTMPSKKVLKLDGDTKGTDRSAILTEFKQNPECTLLMMTYKVGGEGLNIVEANHCIYGEPWWTNAVHNQAKARIWRTGQSREVHTYFIIVKNSIEERVLAICNEKTKLTSIFLKDSDTLSGSSSGRVGLSKFTIGRMLGFYF